MKARNIPLIIQTIMMYVMHLPLYIILLLIRLPIGEDALNNAVNGLLIAFLVLTVISVPICAVTVVISSISVFRLNYNPTKVTMIIKLVLIPWYVMNFIFCAVLIAGFLNPFLMLAIPFAIAILVSFTFLYMLTTSLPDFFYFIYRLMKKEAKTNLPTLISVVFLFFFCLDVIGSIMLFASQKS